MENVLVTRIHQERAALPSRPQFRLKEGDVAQIGDHATDIQAPMRVEVVHDPVAPLDLGEVPRDVVQMRREVHTQ